MKEALFFKTEPLSKVRCVLCPHRCQVGKGKTGMCRVRVNQEGVLVTTAYEEVAAYALDPVEKKPFFHFFPGATLLTYGTNGCTFKCTFCSTHMISQASSPTAHISTTELVNLARQHEALGVAASYSEPVAFFEFALDTARLAREQGLKSVAVTNGFILEEPLRAWLPLVDALMVDFKGNEVFYREVCGGQQEPVLRTIRLALEAKVHVEVSMPLIPSLNDYHEDFEIQIRKLAEISPLIPFHILCYNPSYKMTMEDTPLETLARAYDLARKHLKFVYLGNISKVKEMQATYCPGCGKTLIQRDGHKVLENLVKDSACPHCQAAIPGVFA